MNPENTFTKAQHILLINKEEFTYYFVFTLVL